MMKNLKVKEELHARFKKHCKLNGQSLVFVLEQMILDVLEKSSGKSTRVESRKEKDTGNL